MRNRVERLQPAVRADLEPHRAAATGAAWLIAADPPLVADRHCVIGGRQHGDVRLRTWGGCAQ